MHGYLWEMNELFRSKVLLNILYSAFSCSFLHVRSSYHCLCLRRLMYHMLFCCWSIVKYVLPSFWLVSTYLIWYFLCSVYSYYTCLFGGFFFSLMKNEMKNELSLGEFGFIYHASEHYARSFIYLVNGLFAVFVVGMVTRTGTI